jgi:hypothetical protein
MSGHLGAGSDAHHVAVAQRALVPSCVGPRDQRMPAYLNLVRPAGPDGVDAQVGCHGRRTAIQRPARERLVVAKLLGRRGQPVMG